MDFEPLTEKGDKHGNKFRNTHKKIQRKKAKESMKLKREKNVKIDLQASQFKLNGSLGDGLDPSHPCSSHLLLSAHPHLQHCRAP
jgi:hypothetical protein